MGGRVLAERLEDSPAPVRERAPTTPG